MGWTGWGGGGGHLGTEAAGIVGGGIDGGQQHVAGREVAVEDVVAMQVAHGGGNLVGSGLDGRHVGHARPLWGGLVPEQLRLDAILRGLCSAGHFFLSKRNRRSAIAGGRGGGIALCQVSSCLSEILKFV